MVNIPDIVKKNLPGIPFFGNLRARMIEGFAHPSRYKISVNLSFAMRQNILQALENDQFFKVTDRQHFAVDFVGPIPKGGLKKRAVVASGLDLRKLSFNCEVINLPGAAFSTNDSSYGGPIRKLPFLRNFNDLVAQFLCSPDLFEYRFFQAWQRLIVDRETHIVGYYKEYISEIVITQLDRNDNEILSVIVPEVYPLVISQIPLGYQASNTVERLNVTFARR